MTLQALAAALLLVGQALSTENQDRPAGMPPVSASDDRAAVVLVFDLESMSAGALQRARKAAETLVREGLPRGVAGGVVANGKLVGGRLTEDREELLRALASLRASASAFGRPGDVPLDRGDERAAEIAATLEAGNRTPTVSPEGRAKRTVATLLTLTNSLASLPGTKTVFWFSESLSASWNDREKLRGHEAQVSAVLAAAERAGARLVGVAPGPGTPVLARGDLWYELVGRTGGTFAATDQSLSLLVPRTVTRSESPAAPASTPPATPPAAGTTPAIAPNPAAPGAAPRGSGGASASVSPALGPTAASASSGPLVPRIARTGAADPAIAAAVTSGDDLLPPDLREQARAGWAAYQAGDIDLARTRLAPAAAHVASPPWVHYVLGWAEFAGGDIDRAQAQWTLVRQEAPDFQQVYFDLADCGLRKRDQGEALSVLRDGSKRWPGSVEFHNAIGSILTSRGELDDALRSFTAAVKLEPDDAIGHFNRAKVSELRYLREAETSDAARETQPADLATAAAEYRLAMALGLQGPVLQEAAEGHRRTAILDAGRLEPGPPVIVGSYDPAGLGGNPVRLAWSADGNQMCIGVVRADKGGKVTGQSVHVVDRWTGQIQPVTSAPGWADAYWEWKSAFTAPWFRAPKIASVRRQVQEVFARDGPVFFEMKTFELAREVVGQAQARMQLEAGTTYSWSPYAMGALAYLDNRGVLVVLDRQLRKRDLVGGHGSIMLPAWSPDGSLIAYLEKNGRVFELRIIEIGAR